MSEERTFSVGNILGQSFSLLTGNFMSFILIMALVLSPYLIYTIIATLSMDSLRDLEGGQAQKVVDLLAQIFLAPIATGALMFGVFQKLRGQTAGLNECLSVGFSKMVPIIGVSFLVGLAILGGLILFLHSAASK